MEPFMGGRGGLEQLTACNESNIHLLTTH